MRPLSCSESRWVYALKIFIESIYYTGSHIGHCTVLCRPVVWRSHDPPRFRRACPIGCARSLLTNVWEEEIEVGHGSVEPDNSGGIVDIEGFFLRYGGREAPLPIQRGRQGCSGGVVGITDRDNPAAARTTEGDCSLLGEGARHRLETSVLPPHHLVVVPNGSIAVLPAKRSVSRFPEAFEVLTGVWHEAELLDLLPRYQSHDLLQCERSWPAGYGVPHGQTKAWLKWGQRG